MATVYDVKAEPLIKKVANHLEDEVEEPDWTSYVKTGVSKERPPEQENWFYIRTAAILRQVYTNGPVGVSKLKTKYGDRANHGHGPEHMEKASGKVIRTALQKLEEQDLVEKEEGEGRKITSKGKQLLDQKSSKLR